MESCEPQEHVQEIFPREQDLVDGRSPSYLLSSSVQSQPTFAGSPTQQAQHYVHVFLGMRYLSECTKNNKALCFSNPPISH